MWKPAIFVPAITLAAAAVLLFTIEGCWTSWEGGSAEQRTDDAYVRADMTPLSTRISGTVRKIDVNDYEAVTPGQLLVQLDDDDYRANLEEAKAALAGAEAQLADNQAAKRIQDAKVQSAETAILAATAAMNAAKAGVSAVQPDANRTEIERKRQEALLAELSRRKLVALRGIGQHPTNAWPGEPSFLVPGVTRRDAQALGRQFEQNAIVWSGRDALPELILLR